MANKTPMAAIRLLECSLRFSICRPLHQFGGRRAAIEVGTLLYLQGLGAGLRQRLRRELHDLSQIKSFSQLFALSPPTDFDVAHTGCVVLDLLGVRALTLAALHDHQNILVAAGRD